MKKRSKAYVAGRVLLFLVLLGLAITFIYPVLFMLLNAFKSKAEYRTNPFALPTSLNFENFTVMLNQFQLLKYFGNTLTIAVFSILFTMMASVMASYAFAKLTFRGRRFLYMVIIVTMFIPAQVTMIPMYQIFAKMHLVDTFTGVILSNIAGGIPGTMMLLTANFRGIPRELIEAAQIDGAGYFRILKSVILPMGRSAIVINLIFSFVAQCNDLFTPMILLQGMEKRTAMVALTSIMTRTSGDPAFQMTGLLLAIVPPLLVYIFLQKYMVKGLTVGAVK